MYPQISRTPKVKEFVHAPFWTCPDCGTEGTFGVLMICDRHYMRRCIHCWFDQRLPLPPLDVSVLYLDQNFLSNVLRTLDPDTSVKRRERMSREGSADFFRTAFEKIHRLAKLHLLVCPNSPLHYDKSVVSTDFKKLKRLYEMLSHGVSFWRPDEIRNAQLRNHARVYRNAPVDEIANLSRDRVVHGKLNIWRDWLQITLNLAPFDGLVDELRDVRNQKYNRFAGVWEQWRNDQDRTFSDWYLEERVGLSKVLKEKLADAIRRHIEIRFGRREMSLTDALPNDCEKLAMDLKGELCGDDPDPAGFNRVWEFLESDALDDVPSVRISSTLFAALAQQARGGKKCPPKHPFNDVDAVSAYLPYCDAMFVDNEIATLLSGRAVQNRLGYSPKIFSMRSKGDLLAYLDSIEADAPAAHIEKVREVYGEDWERPFVDVFHQEYRHDVE